MTGYDKALTALRGNDPKLRQMAIVWFHAELDKTSSELHHMGCKLKPSTISSYFKRYANLLKDAIDYFVYNIQTVMQQTTKKVKETTYWCYINKITMPNGELWTKIGKSTNLNKRIKNYEWSPEGITIKPAKVEVKKTFQCKDEESTETLENLLRFAMMAINPLKFKMNDRLLDYKDNYPELICNHPVVQENLATLLVL